MLSSIDLMLNDILSLLNDLLDFFKSELQLIKKVSRRGFLLLFFVHRSIPVFAISLESSNSLLLDSHITKLTDWWFLSFSYNRCMLLSKCFVTRDVALSIGHPVNWEKVTQASVYTNTVNCWLLSTVGRPWADQLIRSSHCVNSRVSLKFREHWTTLTCLNIEHHLGEHTFKFHIVNYCSELIGVDWGTIRHLNKPRGSVICVEDK